MAVQSRAQVRGVWGGAEQGRVPVPPRRLLVHRLEHVVPQSSGHQGVEFLTWVQAIRGKVGVINWWPFSWEASGTINLSSYISMSILEPRFIEKI